MLQFQAFLNAAIFGALALFMAWRALFEEAQSGIIFVLGTGLICAAFVGAGIYVRRGPRWPLVAVWIVLGCLFTAVYAPGLMIYAFAGLVGSLALQRRWRGVFDTSRPDWADEGRKPDA